MSDKEIYMKDLKRAYDVFQWLQINTDNIKKLYEVIENIDLTKLITQEQFEELVKETPTLVRLIENMGSLQLQTEHDTQVLDIDSLFGRTLLNFLFGKDDYESIYFIDYMSIYGTNEYVKINNCYIVFYGEVTQTNLGDIMATGNFKIIGFNGVGFFDSDASSYGAVYDSDNNRFVIITPQGITELPFTSTYVESCRIVSLLDTTIIDI